MQTQVAEKLIYDEHGNEMFKGIDKQVIELKLKGYKASFGDSFAENFERMGLEKIASGLYPDGSHWYRFKPRKI